MENLNTLRKFQNEGFSIERNGEIITLTPKEIKEIGKLMKADEGYNSLGNYLGCFQIDYLESHPDINEDDLEELLDDEEWLSDLNDEIMDGLFNDVRGDIEYDIVEENLNFKFQK